MDKFFKGYLALDAFLAFMHEHPGSLKKDVVESIFYFWSYAPTRRMPEIKEVLAYFRQKEINANLDKLDKSLLTNHLSADKSKIEVTK